MTKDEKITAIVLLITLFFWMMERVFNVSAALTATVSISVLMGFKIITTQEFKSSLGWDVSIFIGCAMTLGTVLGIVGVSDWIKDNLSFIISPIVSNPILSVLAIPVIIFFAKFALVSLITASTVFLLILMPFFELLPFSPLVLIFIVAISVNVWLLSYMNPPFLTTHAAVDNRMIKNKDAMITSVVYLILNIIGLLISLPYWK
ncbi:MAG: anion permease, partial [Anaerococcus sp.]|nr:anion permease [Anaerococcus sp.]